MTSQAHLFKAEDIKYTYETFNKLVNELPMERTGILPWYEHELLKWWKWKGEANRETLREAMKDYHLRPAVKYMYVMSLVNEHDVPIQTLGISPSIRGVFYYVPIYGKLYVERVQMMYFQREIVDLYKYTSYKDLEEMENDY